MRQAPGQAPGIGSITALAFAVVLVPAILVAVILGAFGASLAITCMLGLLTAFVGMGFYPKLLRRLGWVGPGPQGGG
jgi:membrane protein YdbS with pleckstrin-like domain